MFARRGVGFRILKAGSYSTIGSVQAMLTDQPKLRTEVTEGHAWWIPKDDTPVDVQKDISMWMNMDQNDNQGTHDMEILGSIKDTAMRLSEKSLQAPTWGTL